MKRLIAAALIGYVTFLLALAVFRPANPSYAELAQEFCPVEWAALEAFDPPLYLQHYHDQEAARERGTSLAVNAVLHRPFVLALANADFVSHFVSFDRAENHSPYTIAHTQVRLDFVKCLNLSEEGRVVTHQMYEEVYPEEEYSRHDGIQHIFDMTDNLFCMGFDQAFEAFKKLDPDSPYYYHAHFNVTKQKMKVCPAPEVTPPSPQSG